MIRIQSVDHVVLRVTDVENVGRFYIDVLGGAWDRRRVRSRSGTAAWVCVSSCRLLAMIRSRIVLTDALRPVGMFYPPRRGGGRIPSAMAPTGEARGI